VYILKLIDWLIDSYTLMTSIKSDPWGTLYYDLWGRKLLARYAVAARRRDHNAEAMYHLWTYSFYPAHDARVNSWCVSALFLCSPCPALHIGDILYNDVPVSDRED